MTRPQTIFRLEKNPEHPYAMIDRQLLENRALSWRAKGLLAYLLSRPDHWIVRMHDLLGHAREGAYAVKQAILELRRAGHLHIKTLREGGHVKEWIYHIYELPHEPDPALKRTERGHSVMENQQVENQQVENQLVENRPVNNKESNKKDSNKKEDDPYISGGEEIRKPAGKKKRSRREPGGAQRPAPGDHSASCSWELRRYRTVTRRWPNRANWPDVIEALGRIALRLGRQPSVEDLLPFYREWTGRGYNSQSIKWLTEWAASGSVPEVQLRGRSRLTPAQKGAEAIEKYARGLGIKV